MTARRAVLAVVLLSAGSGVAAADRREASIHAHLVGAWLDARDEASTNAGYGPLAGVAVRSSYATRNSYQYDVALTFLAGRASFDEGTFMATGQPARTGPFTLATQAARLDGGVTLRFGVRLIPTIRVAAGLQARHRGAPVVTVGGVELDPSQTGRSADFQVDAVGLLDLGLDYRVNRRLIVGAAVGYAYAVPLGGERVATLEGTVHAAYYWYPRW